MKLDKRFPHIIIKRTDKRARQRRIIAYNDDGDKVEILIRNTPVGKNRFKQKIYKLDVAVL